MNSKHRLLQPDVAWTVFTHCDGDQHFPFNEAEAEMKSVNIENITMVWVTACLKYWQRKLVFERGRLNLLIPKKVILRRTSHWRQKLNIHSNYILGFFTMENFVACFLAKLFMHVTQNLCS